MDNRHHLHPSVVTSYTLGGFIHLLVGLAVVLLIVRNHPGPPRFEGMTPTGGVTT
jgi:hypothetical protein